MRSKKVSEFLENRKMVGRPKEFNKSALVIHINNAIRAVEIAEAEMREKAIDCFYKTCIHNNNEECHAFVVGYETPDDRLHEKCSDIIGGIHCKTQIHIKEFTELIDKE